MDPSINHRPYGDIEFPPLPPPSGDSSKLYLGRFTPAEEDVSEDNDGRFGGGWIGSSSLSSSLSSVKSTTSLTGRLWDMAPEDRGAELETEVEGSRDLNDDGVWVAGVRGGGGAAGKGRLRDEMRKSWTSTRSSSEETSAASSSSFSSSAGDLEEFVRPGVSEEVVLYQLPLGSMVT